MLAESQPLSITCSPDGRFNIGIRIVVLKKSGIVKSCKLLIFVCGYAQLIELEYHAPLIGHDAQ
jgi:hypothetical protein